MGNFWLNFVIDEATAVAAAYVNSSTIKPGIKTALENFILAGQALTAAIQAGQ